MRQLILPAVTITVLFGLSACGKSSDSGSSAVAATNVQTAALVPELKQMRHRASECPRGIEGKWTAQNEGSVTVATYHFEGRTLIGQSVVQSATETKTIESMNYDGEIHELPSINGVRIWYVGACQKRGVKKSVWGSNGGEPVRMETLTYMKRDRLIHEEALNDVKVPPQIYTRSY